MILIDSNALLVLIIGLIDEDLVSKHKRTSIYTKKDFHDLVQVIGSHEKLLVLPNIWTEVDNLLNNFTGNHKWQYYNHFKNIVEKSSEKYLQTEQGAKSHSFIELGLTDSLILDIGTECDFIITSDSLLSDHAKALGIKVYDMVENRNMDFLKE